MLGKNCDFRVKIMDFTNYISYFVTDLEGIWTGQTKNLVMCDEEHF